MSVDQFGGMSDAAALAAMQRLHGEALDERDDARAQLAEVTRERDRFKTELAAAANIANAAIADLATERQRAERAEALCDKELLGIHTVGRLGTAQGWKTIHDGFYPGKKFMERLDKAEADLAAAREALVVARESLLGEGCRVVGCTCSPTSKVALAKIDAVLGEE